MTEAKEPLEADAYGRLDISIRETSFEAGKVSPVAILIRNPFDVSVEIIEILGPKSRHVREYKKIIKKHQGTESSSEECETTETTHSNGFFHKITNALSNVSIKEINFSGLPRVEFSMSPAVKKLYIEAKEGSKINFDNDIEGYDKIYITAESNTCINIENKNKESEFKKTEVQNTFTIEPRCEAIAYFEISTANWLFFTPTRQTLSTQITYQINDRRKTQISMAEFDVKPPLAAMVVGAMSGSVLGSIARILNSSTVIGWQQSAVVIGSSIVMSLIASIALSRKTGTQGFITVEDFFGGFVVGSLIGYGGSEYFTKSIIPAEK